MRLPTNRSFRLLLAGSIVSQLGDWSARLALALLVFERTDSDLMVGVTTGLLTIPWLGPGQWLAQKADRFDRRRLLVACDLTRGLVFILLGFVDLSLPVLFGFVLFVASIDPVFEANRSAMVVDLVSKKDYANAIQATHGVDQAAQLAGFGLGGLLAAEFTPAGALALNGGSFLVSAALISMVRLAKAHTQRKGAAPSFGQAFAFLRKDRISFIAVVATVVTVALANAVETQAPVYGEVVAGLNERGIGLLAAVVPLTTLAIIYGLNSSGRDIPLLRRGITLAFLAAVPASGLLFLGVDRISIFFGYAAVGGIFVLSTTGNIVAGRRIPEEIRVGTFAVLQASVYVGVGIGALAGGFASELTSPQISAGAAMALCVFACLVALIALRRVEQQTDDVATSVHEEVKKQRRTAAMPMSTRVDGRSAARSPSRSRG